MILNHYGLMTYLNSLPNREVTQMIAIINLIGVGIGTALVIKGIQLGDVLRGVGGVLCVVVNLGSLVREGL